MTGDRIDREDDPGWRRMMTWTLIALVATLVMTAIALYLVIYFFDRP
jgi:tetrahydromethanopterin S-methyltransferase subunit D